MGRHIHFNLLSTLVRFKGIRHKGQIETILMPSSSYKFHSGMWESYSALSLGGVYVPRRLEYVVGRISQEDI